MTALRRTFRLKHKRDLWPLVADVKRIGTENARTMLEKFYRTMMEHVDTEAPAFKKKLAELEGREQLTRATILHEQLMEHYRDESSKPGSDRTFDSYVTFQEHKRAVYLCHFTTSLFLVGLEFLDTDERVEDFSYAEDQEKPTLVAARDWHRRARVARELVERAPPMLVLDICRFHLFPQISPMGDSAFVQRLWRKRTQRETVASLIRAASTSTAKPG